MRNSQALARGMQGHGYDLVSGGTDNHIVLADLRARGVDGARCGAAQGASPVCAARAGLIDCSAPPSAYAAGELRVTSLRTRP